jgi:pimeloyl-ACP methyl ester carboxylesterase
MTEPVTPADSRPLQWLDRPGLPRLAYHATAAARPTGGPGVIFLGGFGSNMTGSKATTLEAAAIASGRPFVRFDYRGHGASEGAFAACVLSDWLCDTLAAFDQLTVGPQIVVGSSMGGWLALLLALARPERVKALVGIAAAPDFTRRLSQEELTPAQREALARDGVLYRPSDYGEPMPITSALIADGASHLLLDNSIDFAGPVRLLHGQADPDVPWRTSLAIAERLSSRDVRVILIKDGDHRLSRAQDLSLLIRTIDELAE